MYFETIVGDNELDVEQDKTGENKLNHNEDQSYLLALKIHEDLNRSTFESENKDMKIIDERWELIDSTPDHHQLFNQFNLQFFLWKTFISFCWME